MATQKNIVLIDDHVVVRSGLKALVEKTGPYKVFAEFDSGDDLLKNLNELKEADLFIMDFSMPGLRGDEVMKKLHEANCQIPVLILTLDEVDENVIRLFRLGVRGYLRKNCSAGDMKNAIEEIFARGYYHNEFLTYSIRTNTGETKKTATELILEQLTGREREFLKLVCHEKEFTYEQIADQMKVQPRTVDGYREAIFEKFGIKSKTGLVLFVLKHHLFDEL